jgi:glycosyltransferase involved in cell wall biosynthesis
MGTVRNLVGLDGLFVHQPITGSGQYSLHLWRSMSAFGDDLDPILLRPITDDHANGGRPAGVVIAPPSWARGDKAHKLWWEQRGVINAVQQAGVQLLHTPYFSRPRFSPVSTITTIHDVIPFIFPQYAESLLMRLYLRLATAAARRSTAIITDSVCSRRDIAHWLRISQDRIRVIPLAANEQFQPSADQETYQHLRTRLGLPGPVIFNVGGLDARKNLAVLVEAFARALPKLDPGVRLVIAGRAHSTNRRLYPPLEPVIRSWGVSNHVVLTGPISEEEKLSLYRLADLYVYPSLYEGFGLSPLEAMACGTPVLASNRSSLPEVVGDGGLLVNPRPDQLATAISTMLHDEDLRQALTRRALDQAARFSWRKTAEMTRSVYRDVLGETQEAHRGKSS